MAELTAQYIRELGNAATLANGQYTVVDQGGDAKRVLIETARTYYQTGISDIYAPLASPALTGNPTAPTQAPGNDSTRIANTAFVAAAIAAIPPGASEWGDIGGTLSDQTDLQAALDAKVPVTRTVNGHALSANVTVTPADLSLVIGTNVQAWDSDLDTWATKTAPTGTVVGHDDTQTLSNKTFIAPILGAAQATSLAIGTVSPLTTLHVAETSVSTPRGITNSQHSDSTNSARINLFKSRGTNASPTIIQTGDVLGFISFGGYDGSSYLEMAGIRAVSTGTIATTRVPTQLQFYTATDAAPSVITVALTIGADQNATFVGSVTATSFSGSGASLTNLNASNLASGTVPLARLGSGTANSSTFLRGDNTWAAPPSAPVSSVFGRTGAVVAQTGDYTWAQIDKTVSSLGDLTTRSASDLSSGTLPDARFPATLPAVSGINLTALNASNLGSGTVPTARLGSGTANSSTFLRGDNTWAAPPSAPVSSVFGRTGAVVAQTGDYTWAQIDKTVSSLGDLTTRSASDLSSGTLPDARFPATLPAVSGINLTALNASNLGSGTVPTARLGSGTANSSTFLRGDNTWAAPPSAPVSSVFGRTGAVVAQTGDYGFSQISGSVADGQLSPNVTLLGNTTTGTGAIVRATSPTLVTPTLGVATATSINKVAITQPATGATLTIADGATLTVSANATTSGTNTGDQTILLTGDVTGSGTGSFAATISVNVVTFAKFQQIATGVLLGRSTTGIGNVETITIGSGLSLAGGVLSASGGGAVSSVFGRTGAVAAQTGDYSFSQISGSVADGQLSPNVTLLGNTTTGTGAIVRATSPTLVTPTLGVATATTLTSQQNGIGATSTDAFILSNTTAAAAGAQQWSPRIRWTGQGWKTNATAASQTVEWIAELVPVQGAANPTASLNFSSQINSGGFVNVLSLIGISGGGTGLEVTSGVSGTGITVKPSGGANEDLKLFVKGSANAYLGVSTSNGISVSPSGTLSGSAGAVFGSLSGINLDISGGPQLTSAHSISWANTTNWSATKDIRIFRSGISVLAVAGTSSSAPGTFSSPANSPAQITANQNNYAIGTGLFNRVNSDASRTITGVVAGLDGQLALDWNVGSFDLVYSQQDTNSTAANRFANASGANLTISAGQVALRQYDNTTARWRAVLLGNKTSLTAGDYWVPGMAIPATIGNSALVASTNQVRVVRVFLDQSIQQDRIAINGVTNGAGGKASFGVYSNDGNTLLYYSGLVSTDSASPWSGTQTITLSTGGTIGPGYFLFAWTADNTSATARSFTLDSNLPAVLNQGSFFVGTAANAATGGALPATLGTLTSSNSITSIPIGKFFKS